METNLIPIYIKQFALKIAKDKQTPFFLIDLDKISEAYNVQLNSWNKYFPKFRIAYSYKTNSLAAITKTLRQNGASAEVVSGDELHWAIDDGFEPQNIFFNGPVKMVLDLECAIELGVKVQVDSLDEMHILLQISKNKNMAPMLAIRLATNYRGIKRSHFGMVPAEFETAIEEFRRFGVQLSGLHLHIGSNINDPLIYAKTIYEYRSQIMRAVEQCKRGNFWLNMGGGFPAKSLCKDIKLVQMEVFANNIYEALSKCGIATAKIELVIEPGRSLVEDFGYLVSSVQVQKKREEGNLVIVDAGLHLTRSISNWYHPVEFISDSECNSEYTIYGSNCFESDIFGKNILGPDQLGCGDLVIIGEVGGYDIPTANIWTKAAPAIYGIKDGNVIDIRPAQSWKNVRR